jgi:hypothetical protein
MAPRRGERVDGEGGEAARPEEEEGVGVGAEAAAEATADAEEAARGVAMIWT